MYHINKYKILNKCPKTWYYKSYYNIMVLFVEFKLLFHFIFSLSNGSQKITIGFDSN